MPRLRHCRQPSKQSSAACALFSNGTERIPRPLADNGRRDLRVPEIPFDRQVIRLESAAWPCRNIVTRRHDCPNCLECLVGSVQERPVSHHCVRAKAAISNCRVQWSKVRMIRGLEEMVRAPLIRVKTPVVLLEALQQVSAKPMMVMIWLGSRVRSALCHAPFIYGVRCPLTVRSFLLTATFFFARCHCQWRSLPTTLSRPILLAQRRKRSTPRT